MKGSEIVDLVVVKLEEYTPFRDEVHLALNNGGNAEDETRPVLSYISKSLKQAADEMLRVMPLAWLRFKSEAVSCVPDRKDNRIGSIALPSDFLRLHTLLMEGWNRPVHYTIDEGHPDYQLQYNEWTRGTRQKPVAVLYGMGVSENEKFQEIRYYSVAPSDVHTAEVFRYVPEFDEEREYDSDAAELIALNCARKVAEIFGMTEQMQTFTGEIKNVLDNVRA